MRILIVDDSEDARDVLIATLAAGGYEDVIAVRSGAEALQALGVKEHGIVPPDAAPADIGLVLLDVMMPQMDGIEACARIRQDARYQDLPLVMVTGADDMSSLAQAFVAGANDYVVKPFQRVELLVRVRNAFRLKGEVDRRLKAVQPKAANAIDPASGLLNREAFEEALRASSASLGWTALLKIDGMDGYHDRYGAQAATALSRRLAAGVAVMRGPMGALVCLYERGVIAFAFPPIDREDVRRILDGALQIMKAQAIPYDGASGDVATSSGSFAPFDATAGGLSLANAFGALAEGERAGGDRVVEFADSTT